MRARRSWPRSSVPSGCDHEGVLSLALKSISLTGTRQTRGPATTPTTMTTRTAAPTVASRWRRKRRPVSRQSDGDGSAAERPATGATRRRSAPAIPSGVIGTRSAGRASRRGGRRRGSTPPRGPSRRTRSPVPPPPGGADVGTIDEREPVEVDAEYQNEQEPREERRQGEPDERERRRHLVEDRVGAERRVRANRDGDQDREEQCRAQDDEGGRKTLEDERVHVDSADEREPPVAADHRRDPARIAHGKRVVEAELRPEVQAHLGRDVGVRR